MLFTKAIDSSLTKVDRLERNLQKLTDLIQKKDDSIIVFNLPTCKGRAEIIGQYNHSEVYLSHFTKGSYVSDHLHNEEDESFFVIDGKVEIRVADEASKVLQRGQSISVPKGMCHSLFFLENTTLYTIAIPPLSEIKEMQA